MNLNLKNKRSNILPFLLLGLVLQAMLMACDDDPGMDRRFTTTAEYASDALRNREKFTLFAEIVDRSHMMDLLGTWGSYTVFAPTNEAVDKFLATKGLTSVSQLTQQECDTITFTHIMEQAFFTTDFNDGTYPVMNMLDRPLTVSTDSDTISVPGEVRLSISINKSARLISMDDSVKNGVVHTIDAVISAQNSMLPDVLSVDSDVSLFYQALELTGMADTLQKYIDPTYSVGSDSIDWTNDRLLVHTGNYYDNTAFMEHRYFKYTVFTPRNSVFAKYGVHDLDGLKELARECYEKDYPEDANVDDVTDRRNYLNRFVSYHILPFSSSYYSLTSVDGPNSELAANFNRRRWDIADWYETLMPHSILKCSFPLGSDGGLYVNRRGVQSRADARGYFTRGAKVAAASEVNIDQTAVNGVYFYIDDILSYGYHPGSGINVKEYVFSERMRIDCTALSPDFMTSGARGHYTRSNIANGKYAQRDANLTAATNTRTCLQFKPGSVSNFIFDDMTRIVVRPRTLDFWSYAGDEVIILGRYDVSVKLPPVPSGNWEVRMYGSFGFSSRGIVQFYIDNIPQGIPFDMRPGGTDPSVGWIDDSTLGDEEQIAAFDKAFHNKGWMKGPGSYGSARTSSGGGFSNGGTLRNVSSGMRRVIGTFYSDGKTDHYLRMQQKMESADNECVFDMIELCPATVYSNPDVAEDRL